MKAVQFDDANIILKKPSDMTDEQCNSITAYRGKDQEGFGFFCVGFQPSPEDIQAFREGRPLMIKILGQGFPPISVFTTNDKNEVNPELPHEAIDEEAIIANQERERKAYLATLPPAEPLEETNAKIPHGNSSAMKNNISKFEQAIAETVNEKETKHICPNPDKEAICDDCPKDGCYHS